jgi:hypothetical protein
MLADGRACALEGLRRTALFYYALMQVNGRSAGSQWNSEFRPTQAIPMHFRQT